MPTTIQATALPYSLADDAPFHLTVFVTHKLTGGQPLLSDYPAAADWVNTLAGSTLTLTTSLDPATPLPLRVVSTPDAAAWAGALPPDTPVDSFPEPKLSDATWHTHPASRLSDHAVDLHLAAITAAPTHRPALSGDPVAGGMMQTLASLDQDGPLARLLRDEPARARRALQVPAQRLRDALTTVGPLTGPEGSDVGHDRGIIPPPPAYQSEIVDVTSPVQALLDDPDADNRVNLQLDDLTRANNSANPNLQLMVDAHMARRYYERPEQPQAVPQPLPTPDAPPSPRPDRPSHDFHAKVGSFGSTPALLRALGLAVDVVLDGLTPEQARAALAGATWVSVGVSSSEADLQVLPPRRTAVTVSDVVFTATSSDAWVGGAVPLGDDEWVVLDTDPDASGLKLDQHTRNLARQYASEANGDPATSAPGTLRATGFAIARRERADQLRSRLKDAESLAADDGSRELLLDDLVRGLRVEVWDDRTSEWHSLHRRVVSVTAQPGGVPILTDATDVGFLQLSALNTGPGGPDAGYYLHEVVAGWDGWSLSAPRPGLTIVHVEPPDANGNTEMVVPTPPDQPIDGAQVTSRVAPASLPRLRYGMSYSFRVLAVDLAGNSVPQVPAVRRAPVRPGRAALAAARAHLDRLRAAYSRRDGAGIRAALQRTLAEAPAVSRTDTSALRLPEELLSGDEQIDATLRGLVAGAAANQPAPTNTQRMFDDVATAARILATSPRAARVRPQLQVDAADFAALARNDDLQLPDDLRLPVRAVVTVPRPYLRWEPVPAPVLVAREELGTGEQPAALVVRTGAPDGPAPDVRADAERHLAAPKATQLEAEAAGLFDAAIGTEDAAEIKRLYAVALAERGTLFDQFVPSLTKPRETEAQPGIALADRPGADITSPNRATLADITAERGRPVGEGQYVVHDVDALRLPYLPDPYATGVSLVFYEAGSPHTLPEPRALQAVSVPYPGTWPSLEPLRLVLEPGAGLGARVDGHVVRVTLPPGEQVRAAIASTVDVAQLDKFGLWRSHLASVADPADGYTTDEVVAAAALQRAASSGWTWWLTPSTDLRLVHAVPVPVRPPSLSALSLFLRPAGRSVAALTGLVDVHGPSTDLLLVKAGWTELVDDPASERPQEVSKSDVVVRSSVGEGENTGVLFLYDFQPTGPLAQAFGGIGFHKMLQTFQDTHYRRVTYVPSGATRYAEFFTSGEVPADPPEGEPVVLDIPSSARPAAPTVLDAVPLLRWESSPEPDEPFAWRQVRSSGVRVWLARPWYSSGDGELLGVLVFDTNEWVQTPTGWQSMPKAVQAPDAATSLWAADPIVQHGGSTSNPTSPPLLLTINQLILDLLESSSSKGLGIAPPLHGEPIGGHDRGWPHTPGNPVAVDATVPLRDVQGNPAVRVLGYQPEFDETTRRWFVDVNLQESPALWPFLRLAVARYQPHSIEGCSLSPVALTGWVQPLPSRTLTVSRPDAGHVQVTLSGIVNWLRWSPEFAPDLPGDELGADSPTGADAVRASRLQQSRTVRATVQRRADGAGDLEWETVSTSLLLAVSVDESSEFRATWTGSVVLPDGAGTPDGDAAGYPALRRPGTESSWRVLVEEHELLDADPEVPGEGPSTQPRLVYADEVWL